MHARTIALLGSVAVAAALSAACGGAFVPIGDTNGDGGATDSGTHDSPQPFDGGGNDAPPGDSSSPWSPVCPASPPVAGTPCTQQTVQCEYGGSWWNVACDAVFQCENAVWTKIQPSYEPCTPQPGPNPPECPASYGAVPQGATCSGSTTCWYAQAVCSCQYPLGGPPPPSFDGGMSGNWGCFPEPGCPMPRPRLGSACSVEGTFCTYEACSYGQTCINGTWQSQEMACAGGGAGTP